jgi:hypothetical protein
VFGYVPQAGVGQPLTSSQIEILEIDALFANELDAFVLDERAKAQIDKTQVKILDVRNGRFKNRFRL